MKNTYLARPFTSVAALEKDVFIIYKHVMMWILNTEQLMQTLHFNAFGFYCLLQIMITWFKQIPFTTI